MKRTINEAGLQICKSFEKFMPKPYICPSGKPSIGFGTTRYPNGRFVTLADKPITLEQANAYMNNDMRFFESEVISCCHSVLNENQFSALVCFVYNVGPPRFKTSTLLKKVNANPNDPTIRNEFLKYVFGGDGTKNGIDDDGDGLIDEPGEKLKFSGLNRRRTAEANLYFTQL